ncbi:MAG: TIGR03663 family protein [Chloroflexota bacterium]|nr:TIGR03663 family protein [Chloroflexota bacterium]
MEPSDSDASPFVAVLKSRLNREAAVYSCLVLAAFIMRMWDLGARAVHYDEGIHLGCSRNGLDPSGWCIEAWTHGPFQFIGTAASFAVFGESEVSARLLPAIFGTAIVVLPYFLRRQLGRWGALAVAVLLAFSPLFMYYSRYARNDIYIAFFTLLLIVCIWNYIDSRKSRWLYIGAAALSFSFCTKEVTYINLAIIALFLSVVSVRELAQRVPKRLNLEGLSPQADVLILIGTLALPLFAGFVNLLPGVDLGQDLSNPWAIAIVAVLFAIAAAIGIRWDLKRWLISAAIFYGIFILIYSFFFQQGYGLVVGLWGNVAYWVGEHGTARGGQPEYYYLMMIPIYEFLPVILASIALVYSAITKNLATIVSVVVVVLTTMLFAFSFGMKDAVKEALRVIIYIASSGLVFCALVTIVFRTGKLALRLPTVQRYITDKKVDVGVWLRRFKIQWLERKSLYSALLLLAAGGSILIYAFKIWSSVSEEEPTSSLTSTLLLLCAAASVVLYAHFGRAKLFVKFLIYWAAMSLILFSFFGEKMPWLSLHVILPAIVLGGAFIGHMARGLNRDRIKSWLPSKDSKDVKRWLYSTVAVVCASTLLFLTGYTAYVACKESYQVEDEPPQMLLYAGVSADVPRIVALIEDFASETGMGYDLPITVDSRDSNFDNGWRWYLRDYTNVSTPDLTSMTSEPQGWVLILNIANEAAAAPYIDKYGEGERITMLIWFPEEYKDKEKFTPDWWWGYFLHRETEGPLLNREGIVYFLDIDSSAQ